MISMSRYNKIMNRVEVTQAMNERILKNIEEIDFQSQPKNAWYLHDYRRYISIAACLVLVVVGVILVPNSMNVKQEQIGISIVEYHSKDELSSYIGFEVKAIQSIPFDVEQIYYHSYEKELAEVIYVGSHNTLTFRMAKGDQDISGDYNIYKEIKPCLVGYHEITLKGNEGRYNLAIWKDEYFSYSLQIESGLSEANLIDIIQSIQGIS